MLTYLTIIYAADDKSMASMMVPLLQCSQIWFDFTFSPAQHSRTELNWKKNAVQSYQSKDIGAAILFARDYLEKENIKAIYVQIVGVAPTHGVLRS